MPKPRFIELKFANNGTFPKHSLVGYQVISQANWEGNIELFLRLPDAPPQEKKPRRKTTKRVSKSVSVRPSEDEMITDTDGGAA